VDSWGLELSEKIATEINKISMQMRQLGSSGGYADDDASDAERLAEFTTR